VPAVQLETELAVLWVTEPAVLVEAVDAVCS
jgi:hypothetical protein